ncbi:hypothetical protein GW17_00001965 [Ensete ventricosum]|nr:hypothetical protein GW17_00001965 [Ensete ventricosum]
MEAVVADEGGEAEVGMAGGGGEGELDHHVVGATGGAAGRTKWEAMGTKTPRRRRRRRRKRDQDHCVPSVGLVDTHPPEAGPKTPELVVRAREAACVSQADLKLFFESVCGEVGSTCIAESATAALNCSGVVLGTLPLRYNECFIRFLSNLRISPSKTPVRPGSPRRPHPMC